MHHKCFADAAVVLEPFTWGPEFIKINKELLDTYSAAATSAGVIAAQEAWLKKLEAEVASKGSRARGLPPTPPPEDEYEDDEEEKARTDEPSNTRLEYSSESAEHSTNFLGAVACSAGAGSAAASDRSETASAECTRRGLQR